MKILKYFQSGFKEFMIIVFFLTVFLSLSKKTLAAEFYFLFHNLIF